MHVCVCVCVISQNNDNFEEGLLKLVRTLPKVLKFLPSDKAQDARNFVQSLQYWLGGNTENLENLLLSTAEVSTHTHTHTHTNTHTHTHTHSGQSVELASRARMRVCKQAARRAGKVTASQLWTGVSHRARLAASRGMAH